MVTSSPSSTSTWSSTAQGSTPLVNRMVTVPSSLSIARSNGRARTSAMPGVGSTGWAVLGIAPWGRVLIVRAHGVVDGRIRVRVPVQGRNVAVVDRGVGVDPHGGVGISRRAGGHLAAPVARVLLFRATSGGCGHGGDGDHGDGRDEGDQPAGSSGGSHPVPPSFEAIWPGRNGCWTKHRALRFPSEALSWGLRILPAWPC